MSKLDPISSLPCWDSRQTCSDSRTLAPACPSTLPGTGAEKSGMRPTLERGPGMAGRVPLRWECAQHPQVQPRLHGLPDAPW